MIIIRQQISNHPSLSKDGLPLQRWVNFKAIIGSTIGIELKLEVEYESNILPRNEVTLIADETTIVDAQGNFYLPRYIEVEEEVTDPETGDITTQTIQELIIEDTFNQLQFLFNLNGPSLKQIIEFEIIRADSYDRFDVV